MNNQSTLALDTTTTDLVLKFVGGRKDGQEVSINTARCMLGVKSRDAATGEPTTGQCALYRGSAGVALQCRGTEVLINGQPASTRWLQVGDHLQLSATHAVEVVQLGSIAGEIDPSIIAPPATRVQTVTEPMASAETAESSYETAVAAVEEAQAVEQPSPVEADSSVDDRVAYTGSVAGDRLDFVQTQAPRATDGDERLAAIESSIDELRGSSEVVNGRFDRLENSLDTLTKQLQKLTSHPSALPLFESPEPTSNVTAAEQASDSFQDAFESLTSATTASPEATAEATEAAPPEDYHNSIASQFSDLASEPSSTEATPASRAVEPTVVAESSEVAESQTLADLMRDDVVEPLDVTDAGASVEAAFPQVEIPQVEIAQPSPIESVDVVAEVASDAAVIGSPEPMDLNPAESVADIFARLQNDTADSFDNFDEPATEPPAAVAPAASFEDIEASISAAFDQEPEASTSSAADDPQSGMPDTAAEPTLKSEPASFAPEQSVTTEPTVIDAESAPMAEVVEALPATPTSGNPSGDDSVDDYMSMLLTRMRGDSDGSGRATSSQPSEAVTHQEVASTSDTGDAEAAPTTETLTEEEFLPRCKAAPIKSFDKMRELANSTTRSAIQRSISIQKQQRSKSLVLQSLSLGSLALAAVMAYGKAMMPATAFGMIFAVTFGYLIYDTIKPVTNVETVTASKKPAAPTTEEATADEAE